jgi:hypothetical protein
MVNLLILGIQDCHEIKMIKVDVGTAMRCKSYSGLAALLDSLLLVITPNQG